MNIAIILCSGNGERIKNNSEKKCFIEVCNKPLFSFSLNTFLEIETVDYIYLIIPTNYEKRIKNYNNEKIRIVYGANSRKESVLNGLRAIKQHFKDDNPFVLIHDGARPLIDKNIILNHLEVKNLYDGSLTAIESYDSLIKLNKDIYKGNVDRNKIYIEQTPTCSHLNNFLYAFELGSNLDVNDEATLLKNSGFNIKRINGSRKNFKITDDDDLDIFTSIIK